MKKGNVVKPHVVITARMDLSAREQDLLTLLMLSIKKKYDELVFNTKDGDYDLTKIPQKYTYTKSELAEIFGVTPNSLAKKEKCQDGQSNYLFENACKALWNKGIEIKGKNGNFMLTRLLSYAEYDGRTLTLEIPSIIVSEMLDYSRHGMGIIDYKLLFKLKGQYEKRILELISRFKNKRDFECTIGEFCLMVGTKLENYVSWRAFSNTVLIKSLSNIEKSSGGMWKIKSGKGFEIKKTSNKKSYDANDIIILKMKYNELGNEADNFKKEYQSVLDGGMDSVHKLNNILANIDKFNLDGYKATPEFIKMWAACMAATNNSY